MDFVPNIFQICNMENIGKGVYWCTFENVVDIDISNDDVLIFCNGDIRKECKILDISSDKMILIVSCNDMDITGLCVLYGQK